MRLPELQVLGVSPWRSGLVRSARHRRENNVDEVWCAKPGDEHVRSQARNGCAFWQREPGADFETDKNKTPPARAGFRGDASPRQCNLRRRANPIPARPMPKSASVAGSGAGATAAVTIVNTADPPWAYMTSWKLIETEWVPKERSLCVRPVTPDDDVRLNPVMVAIGVKSRPPIVRIRAFTRLVGPPNTLLIVIVWP